MEQPLSLIQLNKQNRTDFFRTTNSTELPTKSNQSTTNSTTCLPLPNKPSSSFSPTRWRHLQPIWQASFHNSTRKGLSPWPRTTVPGLTWWKLLPRCPKSAGQRKPRLLPHHVQLQKLDVGVWPGFGSLAVASTSALRAAPMATIARAMANKQPSQKRPAR